MPSPNRLDKLITKIGGAVDQYALASELLSQLGGITGLCKRIVECLDGADKGSAAQAQTLRAVLELIGKVSRDMGSKMLEEEIPDKELEDAVADAKAKSIKRIREPGTRRPSGGDCVGGGDADSVADWGDGSTTPRLEE
jgi:hypothetical protein